MPDWPKKNVLITGSLLNGMLRDHPGRRVCAFEVSGLIFMRTISTVESSLWRQVVCHSLSFAEAIGKSERKIRRPFFARRNSTMLANLCMEL